MRKWNVLHDRTRSRACCVSLCDALVPSSWHMDLSFS